MFCFHGEFVKKLVKVIYFAGVVAFGGLVGLSSLALAKATSDTGSAWCAGIGGVLALAACAACHDFAKNQ